MFGMVNQLTTTFDPLVIGVLGLILLGLIVVIILLIRRQKTRRHLQDLVTEAKSADQAEKADRSRGTGQKDQQAEAPSPAQISDQLPKPDLSAELSSEEDPRTLPASKPSSSSATPEVKLETAGREAVPSDQTPKSPGEAAAPLPEGHTSSKTKKTVPSGESEPDAQSQTEAQPSTEVGPQIEAPEPASGRLVRLRARLAKSGAFGQQLLKVFSRGDLSIEDWEEIEDALLLSDLGVEASEELIEQLRTEAKVLNTSDITQLKQVLQNKLLQLVDPQMDRSLKLVSPQEDKPGVVLVVGVNGTGKTTTVGKIARLLVAEGKQVVLGAGDTFRAAGAQQLQTWGQRVGVPVVASPREGGDPAAVAFDTVKTGIETQADVVLVDTAGRLQNKKDLMDELGKVKRVMEKSAPVTETLLVLDATTGQNGLQQAKVFSEVVDLSGIVLTKLDGSAKGGIVISVQRELGIPVKLVGLGEGPDDLAPFDPQDFVQALVK